jgi:hypothetical protein
VTPVCMLHIQVHNLTVDGCNYAHAFNVAGDAIIAMPPCNEYDACKQPYIYIHQQHGDSAGWGTTKQPNRLKSPEEPSIHAIPGISWMINSDSSHFKGRSIFVFSMVSVRDHHRPSRGHMKIRCTMNVDVCTLHMMMNCVNFH